MKFSLCIAALVSVAVASSMQDHQDFVKRQVDSGNAQGEVPAEVAAMTDADGNVVEFDASKVVLGAARM
ncbi:hypothetical protein CMQ_2807 [Grosmannia clavigera kw1407]|uniref:Uncharacterized protein n=1 Tax=Grosmannia clavigera (strain kw1407 / UAMH 11150) TaxID=655863 RepID=F0XGH5_GROCL|nr:uncharacterized protein CMQ_2807 [Grosmannia clavigera kw1407]EFX02878.1 hypothetical protein CMQ_2807 [Grosmannia clavigera kw1407]